MDFKQKFLEKGLTPLEEIRDAYHKVACIDSEGYKYYLCYHGAVGDKRTKHFDRWSKQNPFKPYNMRLFANRVQENVKILSADEELQQSTTGKIRFVCPHCGKEYKKKWCHWIAQPKNKHFCPKCSSKLAGNERRRTQKELTQEYMNYGYILLSPYEEYIKGGNSARLFCIDADGYKFATSINSLANGNSGTNKFSSTNPFALENFQKWCDDNNTGLKIIEQISGARRLCYNIQCSCGNNYFAEPNQVITLERRRCPVCSQKESRFELKTKEWLEQNNIPFIQEYRFEDCRNKRSLPFDFRCDWHDKVVLIEVDGGQHYYVTQWTDENDLKEQKVRDKIKTQYCKSHGYVLLRIPFWLYNSGTYRNKLQETFFGSN